MGYEAWVAPGPKQKLLKQAIQLEPLGAEDVEIAVEHCGICHSDLSVLNNEWGISRFPAVRRDLAIVVAEEVSAEAVRNVLREAAGEALQDLQLFDFYQGSNIQKGKKSLALGLTFQHPSRTLADADINPIIDNCIKALEAKFNAELR